MHYFAGLGVGARIGLFRQRTGPEEWSSWAVADPGCCPEPVSRGSSCSERGAESAPTHRLVQLASIDGSDAVGIGTRSSSVALFGPSARAEITS